MVSYQEAIEELQQHPIFQQQRLTPEELDTVVKMISRSLDVKMVPGDTFEYIPERKVFVYNRPQLLAMHPKQGPGLAFHNVGHALFSNTKQKLGPLSNQMADAINKQAGHQVISGGQIPELINSAEDERMEKLVRKEWPNLDNNFLPRHDQDYRADFFKERQKYLAEVTQPGDMVEDGKGGQKSAYWDRVGVAIRGLVSGALSKGDLPKDMAWDDPLVKDIEGLGNAPTCDEMIGQFQSILQRIAAYREEPPPPSGGGQGDDQGGEGQEQGQSGGQGDAQSQGQGQGKGCKHNHPDKGACEAIKGEVQSTTQQKASQGTTFVNVDEGGNGAGFDTPPPSDEFVGPSWGMVRSTVANIIGPLKKTLDRFFKDNELADKMTGLKSGRFNGRAFMRSTIGNTGQTNYFTRRNIKGQKSYAVKMLIDMSGSMSCGLDGEGGSHEEVFGMGFSSYFQSMVQAKRGSGYVSSGSLEQQTGARYQLACRLTVAISEALGRFKEVKTSISSYTDSSHRDGYRILKTFRQHLSADIKQGTMDDLCQTRGGTIIAPALKKISTEFKNVQANAKVLVILTDGDLGDGGGVQEQVNTLKKQGVETVVLTVGCGPESARRFVGNEYADEVTDTTLGEVLAKHLRRMVR